MVDNFPLTGKWRIFQEMFTFNMSHYKTYLGTYKMPDSLQTYLWVELSCLKSKSGIWVAVCRWLVNRTFFSQTSGMSSIPGWHTRSTITLRKHGSREITVVNLCERFLPTLWSLGWQTNVTRKRQCHENCCMP